MADVARSGCENRGFDELEIYSPAAFTEIENALDEKPEPRARLDPDRRAARRGDRLRPDDLDGERLADHDRRQAVLVRFRPTRSSPSSSRSSSAASRRCSACWSSASFRTGASARPTRATARGSPPRSSASSSSARSETSPRSTRCCARTTRRRSTLSRRSRDRAAGARPAASSCPCCCLGCWEQWSEELVPADEVAEGRAGLRARRVQRTDRGVPAAGGRRSGGPRSTRATSASTRTSTPLRNPTNAARPEVARARARPLRLVLRHLPRSGGHGRRSGQHGQQAPRAVRRASSPS